ncbi:MAG: hypothetical protein ABI083_03175 [Lapillicoccus sp.]
MNLNEPSDADRTDLRDAVARAIAATAGVDPTGDSSARTLVRLAGLTLRAESEVKALLVEAVLSARSAGASWDALGTELGMSRQAAQQRFGSPVGQLPPSAGSGGRPERRRVRGLTAVNEMEELARAGRAGWHSVGFGFGHHDLERTDTQWEHIRVGLLGPARAELEAEGWQFIGTWFPWVYLRRDLGIPADVNG